MSEFLQLHHASLMVENLQRSLEFYTGLLGMQRDHSRPEMAFHGAWLAVGNQQLHLLELPNPDPVNGRPAHAGRDRHTAFSVTGIDELERKLEQVKHPFTRSRSGRRAIFLRDPDGNGIELIEA